MLFSATIVGLLATAALDALGILLHYIAKLPKAEWRYVGRWFSYMSSGVFRHPKIYESTSRNHELLFGWLVHYAIGVIFSVSYFLLLGVIAASPSLANASLFGLATLIFPYMLMQPCMGYGFFARQHPRPVMTPVMSFLSHLTFGQLLFVMYSLVAEFHLYI